MAEPGDRGHPWNLTGPLGSRLTRLWTRWLDFAVAAILECYVVERPEAPDLAVALDLLMEHDWPGNVQELRDVIEQSMRRGGLPADALADPAAPLHGAPEYSLDWTLEQVKRHHMARVLAASDGNKSAAARHLDISRKTLDRKLGTSGRE